MYYAYHLTVQVLTVQVKIFHSEKNVSYQLKNSVDFQNDVEKPFS